MVGRAVVRKEMVEAAAGVEGGAKVAAEAVGQGSVEMAESAEAAEAAEGGGSAAAADNARSRRSPFRDHIHYNLIRSRRRCTLHCCEGLPTCMCSCRWLGQLDLATTRR